MIIWSIAVVVKYSIEATLLLKSPVEDITS